MGASEASTVQIVLGVTFLILMIIGLMTNATVILTFRLKHDLQTPTNILIIGCVICDVLMVLIGFPFVIASCFYGSWLFGQAWCEGYGFITTFLGVTNICILSGIALDRYIVVLNLPFARRITAFKAVMTILSCAGYGLLWATFPLVGWGGFVVEHSGLSCGPDWGNMHQSARSYNVTILVLVFGFPIGLIIYCYSKILCKVKKYFIVKPYMIFACKFCKAFTLLANASKVIALRPYCIVYIP